MKYLLSKKSQERGLNAALYQIFKELIPILLKFFQKENKEEKMLPTPFYNVIIILLPKPDRDTTTRENYRSISLRTKCKNS